MTPSTVITVETPSLGDRSYLVHDGEVAFVVDPQRDIDRMLAAAADAGVRITHVFETHVHNDYVTGGHALAHAVDATYSLNADDDVTFDHHGVHDGDVITVGTMDVTVLATPGHTFTHLAYAVSPAGAGLEAATAVLTGGSLLFGATGRPDLLGPEHTDTLVRSQHASVHRLADLLPDAATVHPTHGFGSFCSATQSDATSSTIGDERLRNPALTQDEDDWVEAILAGLNAWPAYYAHMAPANSSGPAAPDLTLPERADAEELRRRLADGEWVVDLRNRTAFAAEHAPGTFNFGIEGPFATYLGWIITWGTPLTLLGESVEQVAQAQRELVRIGIDRPAAHATGTPAEFTTDGVTGSYPTATFADLADVLHHRDVVVVDVRNRNEFAEAHIDGAVNVPLPELVQRAGEIPAGQAWVHCAAGYRAAAAASILAAAGLDVVAVDDSFDSAREVGLVR
ncbi:MBL fold metallo-hydrolase [Nocardioides yefusunii]|uniref:Rhodanese-like domain-containing protein n=1 Tax=Nocardioides yefusunii TaxID=2500546 RepID=A0ABW1QZE0_9ACTN|nr:MBL fold metallo-hydrolase [Nocardioides yefusunii]